MSDRVERTNNAIEQLAEVHGKLLAKRFNEEKRMRDEDMDCIRSYRRE